MQNNRKNSEVKVKNDAEVVGRSVETVVGRSRFIISVDAGINPVQAFYFCLKVAQQGKISGDGATQQHCYATRFVDGTMVYVRRNKSGSEQFTVHAPPNPKAETRET